MEIGVSCACFYPLETECALKKIGEQGFKMAELFVNSFCEMRPPIINEILSVQGYYGIDVRSIHPYTSFAESFLLFSEYKRRFIDGLEFYKDYFEFANRLGAKIVVIHGAGEKFSVDNEEYFDRFAQLAELGRASGLKVAQENVVRHRSQSPEFIAKMSNYLGDLFSMVLDVKQCLRSGVSPLEYINSIGKKICHVHLSDNTSQCDCLPPGKGEFDFDKLFSALFAVGSDADGVIELYSSNFETAAELRKSADYLINRIKISHKPIA